MAESSHNAPIVNIFTILRSMREGTRFAHNIDGQRWHRGQISPTSYRRRRRVTLIARYGNVHASYCNIRHYHCANILVRQIFF